MSVQEIPPVAIEDHVMAQAMVDYLARLRECRPLQTRLESDAATQVVTRLGFPSHHDPQKNWDTFKAIAYVRTLKDRFDRFVPVLDAGSGARMVAPRWLRQLNYKHVYACDVQGAQKDVYKPLAIKFSVQDLTRTTYEDAFFQAVTCISVIEHNIPFEAFAEEMARVLKPGGLLLVSTDYWSEPIDCTGIFPYGPDAGQMRIIDPKALESFADICTGLGLELCEPLQFDTTDKAVRWERVDRDYTFAFAAFRKRD